MILQILAFLFVASIGIGLCFFGYRIFLVILPVLGFFAGLWLCWTIIEFIFGASFWASLAGILIGFLIGAILAVLSYFFYIIGVVLVAGAIGAALATALMNALGFETGLIPTLIIIAAALGGAVITYMLNLQKYVVTGLTVIFGADLVILAGLVLFGTVTLDSLREGGNLIAPVLDQSWIAMIIWLGIAIAGFIFQVRANRNFTFTRERFAEGWG
jgi:hypothetical protein